MKQALTQVRATVVAAKNAVTDPSVARWRKIVLIAGVAYLLMPIDLIPDFIPILGWADDALVVLLLLWVLRGAMSTKSPEEN